MIPRILVDMQYFLSCKLCEHVPYATILGHYAMHRVTLSTPPHARTTSTSIARTTRENPMHTIQIESMDTPHPPVPTLHPETITAIVPVLNEEKNVGSVVSGLISIGVESVIVVDNGSTDESGEVARKAGATVVHESKRGYGAACWTGLENLPAETDWVLFCAGDGQDDVKEVLKLIEATQHADFVLGNRLGTYEGASTLTAPQKWASWIGGVVIWMGWGFFYKDIGGMRIVNRNALKAMCIQDRGFGFFVEMQVKAVSLDLAIQEVDINYRPRKHGQTKISGTIRGTLTAATILVITVLNLYWKDFWSILTSPSPHISLPQHTAKSPSTSAPMSDMASSLKIEVLDPNDATSPNTESKKQHSLTSSIKSLEGGGKRYPGFPVYSASDHMNQMSEMDQMDQDGDVESRGVGNNMQSFKRFRSLSGSAAMTDMLNVMENEEWKRVGVGRTRALMFLAAFLSVYGTVLTSVFNDPKEVGAGRLFAVGVVMMGGGYGLMQAMPGLSGSWFWSVCLLTRLAALLAAPFPGDDAYRFVWEGWIQLHGFNPYTVAPVSPTLRPLRGKSAYMSMVYKSINHPDTESVYPPLAQLMFRLLAVVAGRIEFFKLTFVLADLAVCWLLSRHFGWKRGALYAWSPLAILASASGGHHDSWMILPLVVAWFCAERGRWALSALFVGISVAFKWVSAPFLPFLIVAVCEWRGWLVSLIGGSKARATRMQMFAMSVKKSAVIVLMGLAPLVLSAIPFCTKLFCKLAPVDSKWASYTRMSDFLPRILLHTIPQSGTMESKFFVMSLIPILAVIYWSIAGRSEVDRKLRFAQFGELYFFLLLVFSPIVHFWYFTWALPFACQTQNWGPRIASVSAFMSLMRYSHKNQILDWWEWCLMWLPYVLAWIVFKLKLVRRNVNFRVGEGKYRRLGKGV